MSLKIPAVYVYLIVTHSPPTGVHSIKDTQISAHYHITHNHVHTPNPTLFSCKPSPPVSFSSSSSVSPAVISLMLVLMSPMSSSLAGGVSSFCEEEEEEEDEEEEGKCY